MSPVMKPASHPQGTTVEVLDLFYNTPVQRRFLKSDKTESGHTEDVVRRLTSSPTFALRDSGGGFPLVGDD